MIIGKKVNLRLIKEKDLEFLRESRNRYKDKFFTQDYITKEQQRNWYEKYKSILGKDLMFMVLLKDETKIGTISIYNIDSATRMADFGRMLILEEYQGEGYAKEAIELIIDFAFNTLKLWKLKLSTFLDSANVIALYSSCGFKAVPRPIMMMEATNSQEPFKDPLTLPGWIEDGE